MTFCVITVNKAINRNEDSYEEAMKAHERIRRFKTLSNYTKQAYLPDVDVGDGVEEGDGRGGAALFYV